MCKVTWYLLVYKRQIQVNQNMSTKEIYSCGAHFQFHLHGIWPEFGNEAEFYVISMVPLGISFLRVRPWSLLQQVKKKGGNVLNIVENKDKTHYLWLYWSLENKDKMHYLWLYWSSQVFLETPVTSVASPNSKKTYRYFRMTASDKNAKLALIF